jgi:outer membrane protein OmpA-like peptidoglycan-associated protein
MKKLLILLVAACGSASAIAQEPNSHETPDYLVSRWVFDVNLLGGMASQTFTTANTAANYPNGLNLNTGNLKYNNGSSFGGDAQIGFFFGQMRHFGIGTGFLYTEQHGNASLDGYHAEYQATDGNGNIYRQVVTGNNINEVVNSSNMNIPLVLKYKTRFNKHWGFSTDAGALINLQMRNNYTTSASFNYEAIYKLEQTGDAGTTSVYDNSPVASPSDWFVTKAEFLKNNPGGNYQNYVNTERAAGINVGEGLSPNTTKGTTSYTMGSVGLLVQPSLNYYLSDYVALNLGVYYMMQPFKNGAQSNYRLESGIGTYNSVLNNVTASTNQEYGINFGARFFFRKNQKTPLNITFIDESAPTQCLLSDGSFTLHGLTPNQPVTVDYSFNGGSPNQNTSTVQADGNVIISNLGAGNYSGISATIRKQNAKGKDLTISDPVITIKSQSTVNPTTPGRCDGSVMFSGLKGGSPVVINYLYNGVANAAYTGTVNSDNSVTISGLCEGKYTGMVATVGNCSTNGADFLLAAPIPAPAPAVIETEVIDISGPVLFDFNKSTIHVSSYPMLNEASKEMIDQNNMYIRVDAHTDAIGSSAYNQKLSERRGKAVKTYLTKRGANPSRIKVYGHGKSEPAASNDTDEGRSKNRRAVLSKVTDGK